MMKLTKKMISLALALIAILSLHCAAFADQSWGPWSSWSNTPVAETPYRQVEKRSILAGYNMVHYGTQLNADANGHHYRAFRDYSIKGEYDKFNARRSYGEKHFTRTATVSQMNWATTYAPGTLVRGDYPGYQLGNKTAYAFGDDKYVWFVASEIYTTEYRYRELNDGGTQASGQLEGTEADKAGKPSAADLDNIHANIKYPNSDFMYLDEYISATVTHRAVYCFRDPDHDIWRNGNYYTVTRGTQVTILAESMGYACVIIDGLHDAGWINVDYLSNH